MTQRRPKRIYTDQFKYQIVALYNNGKSRSDIVREYNLDPATFDRWVNRINSFSVPEKMETCISKEIELMHLYMENQRLKIENDILKQTVMIFGQK